ncbi:MAG TPA: hypothetical protein VGL94_14050 [Ktedonobacteraceae bacterium]
MRCSNCGLPLSPSRTTCPRCGTTYNGTPRKGWSEQDTLLPQAGTFAPGNMPPAGPNGQPGHVEAEVPYAQWNAYPAPTFHEAPAGYSGQTPTQTGQELSPASDKDHAFFDPSPTVKKQSMPHQVPQYSEQYRLPTTPPQTISQSPGWEPTAAPLHPFPQATYNPGTPQRSQRTMRIGFSAAGICLIVGALILTFVSILAQPLLSSNTGSPQATPPSPRSTLPATIAPSPTVATPTPAGVFPGAQYITNAHMATAIDQTTGQATQYATNFTTNQRIYVTFSLNTGSQGGAVCLMWYMNTQYISQYEFAVEKNQLDNSYSYNSMSNAGTGYVEIYWATTATCTDKLLAAHVTFTVS